MGSPRKNKSIFDFEVETTNVLYKRRWPKREVLRWRRREAGLKRVGQAALAADKRVE